MKSGYYCGEGGVKCHHGEGYIYCESGTTETDAMKMDGFVWNDENNDWDKSANHASITVKIPCLHGYLLCYRITGEA